MNAGAANARKFLLLTALASALAACAGAPAQLDRMDSSQIKTADSNNLCFAYTLARRMGEEHPVVDQEVSRRGLTCTPDGEAIAPDPEQLRQQREAERIVGLQTRSAELISKYGRKQAEQIVHGNIDYGMSEDEVMLAWGDPKSRKASGHSKAIWDYGDDKVTFTKGKVSAVGH